MSAEFKDSLRRTLITGGQGLLARAMRARLSTSGWEVLAPSHSQLDITNELDVQRTVAEFKPDLVMNCASTGDVDRCEREPDWAYSVNELGPRLLARACTKSGAEMFHTSTDYVFDGAKQGYYSQEDEPRPQSVYGKSKLAGEIAVSQEAARFYIIRTSWLFGVGGKNFGSRLFEYARANARLKGVTDQTSIPTYAPDLARRIEEIIALRAHGLYHGTNSGVATWYEFARLALDLAGMSEIDIEPVTRRELRQLAPRPVNSAMRCLLSEKLGLVPLRHWREAVVDFVREIESSGINTRTPPVN
ncbi:MAG TPA: dTDP-4-dehydrorhamnose reductase [Blastocatellia bacterium]|nr:dTDP-4-dehydrorhamnose reductase [Blastocatellia bacterium]